MNHEEPSFEKLFAERLKQRGITIKKISDMTGISRTHIENIASGNFKDLPSAPYFRGYLIRLGKILDFDGETWWETIKKESVVKKSGPKDTMPQNRFMQKRPTKFIWAGIVFIVAIAYFILQFARISGKPAITVVSPAENPYTASSSQITLQGTVTNADSLFVNGDNVPIASGGAWQKIVLLQDGLNTLAITAKKFLGGESTVVEQIIYQSVPGNTATPSSTSSSIPPVNVSGTAQ